VTAKLQKRLIEAAHDLNRRIQENPRNTLKTTKEFYAEKVYSGSTDEADFALLMSAMMTARQEDNAKLVPSWFKVVGFIFGGITLLFLMALVVASMWGIRSRVNRGSSSICYLLSRLHSVLLPLEAKRRLPGKSRSLRRIPWLSAPQAGSPFW
jgi:hypothetical protein